jgi:dTDP-4-dehydrorhamnose 3,5-epimerase
MYTTSHLNVLRGLHFQEPEMGKLIEVVSGAALLVAVDVRPDSPTFLQHHGLCVSASNPRQIWAPGYFARGYLALENETVVHYRCDAYQGEEKIIRWNDPRIGIEWETKDPILSEKDTNAPTASELFL